MKSLFVCLAFVLATGIWTQRASADGALRGAVSILVVDSNKSGVAGVNITLTVAGVSQTVTSGSEQPSDAEVATAAKQDIDCKCHAVDTLMSRYNAAAKFDGVAYGTGTIKIDAKNAKPLAINISEAQPTWSLIVIVDPNSKRLVNAKLVFDEAAFARAQVAGPAASAPPTNTVSTEPSSLTGPVPMSPATGISEPPTLSPEPTPSVMGTYAPFRSGATFELGVGFGGVMSAPKTGETTTNKSLCVALGLGGFVRPDLAVTLRVGLQFTPTEVVDQTSQIVASGSNLHYFIGPTLQIWVADQFWLGGGVGLALERDAVTQTSGTGLALSGLGVDLRAGLTLAGVRSHTLDLSVEVTPSLYGDLNVYGFMLLIGVQEL